VAGYCDPRGTQNQGFGRSTPVEDRPVKLVATLSLALGVATVVAGCLAFTFGLGTSDVVVVSGWGPLDRLWEPPDYCILGTLLAAGGSGLTTFSLAWIALLFRHGQAILPRRRWLLWSLALLAGTARVGLTALLSQRAPKLSQADVGSARTQVAILLVLAGEGKDVEAMTTPEYQRRERALKQSVTYRVATYRTTSTVLHDAGQITVRGSITAPAKTTVLRMEGGLLVGGGVVKTQLDPPKEIGFTARLVKGESDLWLIDELVFEEE
jgi:hypothetical protein